MAKRTRNKRAAEASDAMRRANWQAKRDAMAEGRVQRAHTFQDRKRAADKRKARGRSVRDW